MHMQSWLPLGLIAAQLLLAAAGNAQDVPQPNTGDTIALQPVPRFQRGRLDLRPPKLTELFTQEAIDRALRTARDANTIEEVEVEARRSRIPMRTPDIPGGILAPFWALLHPTEAWRIFLPLAPDQAEQFSGPPPSATDPYRPVMLGPAFR